MAIDALTTGARMEVLSILTTVVLGFFLWDVHKGTKAIAQMGKDVAAMAKEVRDKTDAILGRRR